MALNGKYTNIDRIIDGVYRDYGWTHEVNWIDAIEWVGEQTIHDGIKDNLEFFRLSNGGYVPQVIDLSGGGADAIIVFVDLAQVFGNPWGLRLEKGTTDKLLFRINDDIATGIVEFNIIGYGTKI